MVISLVSLLLQTPLIIAFRHPEARQSGLGGEVLTVRTAPPCDPSTRGEILLSPLTIIYEFKIGVPSFRYRDDQVQDGFRR